MKSKHAFLFCLVMGWGLSGSVQAQSDSEQARIPLRLLKIPEVRFDRLPLDQAIQKIAAAANQWKTEGRPIEIIIAPGSAQSLPLVSVNILEQDLDLILNFVTEQAGYDWRVENGRIVVFTNPERQKLHVQLQAIPGRDRLRSTILPEFSFTETPLSTALSTLSQMARAKGLRQLHPGGGVFEILPGYQSRNGEDFKVSGRFVESDLDTVLEVITKQTRRVDWTVDKGKVVIIVPGATVSRGRRGAGDPFAASVDPFAAAPAASGGAMISSFVAPPTIALPPGAVPEFNTESYDNLRDNPFLSPANQPLSTFSIDVDTASYSNVRRFLTETGQVPPIDAVRIEELVNYFDYDDPSPAEIENPERPELPVEHPFATRVEVAAAPWKPQHRLVRIGLKGYEIPADKRPASNLVFLLDVSGSMSAENKLPLVKRSMNLLLNGLTEKDRVAIVVYAGSSGLVLESTSAGNPKKILAALERLKAGGSTNGGEGIELAYKTATENLIPEGNNRVILCTDGDFNIGTTGKGELKRVIEEKAKQGIQLTILGFGMGNYKDDMLETLSNYGDGNYGYIDSEREARKLFGQRLLGTLVMIAKDVKMQIEFNPRHVAAYRLIGYENRILQDRDFEDDKIDAGDIGSGHTVTAFYEIVPPGVPLPDQPGKIDLKYQKNKKAKVDDERAGELMTLKLRYKWPGDDASRLIETPVTDDGQKFNAASRDFQFGAAVAGFGMLLRESPHRGKISFDRVLKIARGSLGPDPFGERDEFTQLVSKLIW